MTHTATTTITLTGSGRAILRNRHRDGWGELAGHHNRALREALGALEVWHGTATLWQISRSALYSERWTRVALHRLEALGLITWEPR
jgi:hypothetical protein